MNKVEVVPVGVIARKSLEAVKVLACRACNAPGVFRAPKNPHEWAHYSKWPKIIVEIGSPSDGQPVGAICPCCGASREGLFQKLGEIWHRFW